MAPRAARAARAGWRARKVPGATTLQGQSGQGMASAFWRSLSVNAANPKALTTWLAVVAMFPTARATGTDIALLCAGACGLSFSIHTAYAFAFSTPVAARAYLRAAPVINTAVAVFFLGFALRLALSVAP